MAIATPFQFRIVAILADDVGDAWDLGWLWRGVGGDGFHLRRVEWLVFLDLSRLLGCGMHLEHLAASFEDGTLLDHE